MVWKVKIIHYEKKILPQYNSGKWSTEWLPKCESYPQRGKKLFKTPNQGKSCLCNSSNWLWQMSNFLAFSSDKASFGKKAGWNASYNRCDISVHWDHKRSSAKCKQNRSCSGNDRRRQYWCFKVKLQNCKLRIMVLEGMGQHNVKKVRKASCAYCY